MPRVPAVFSVSIDKLVHGGQGLGTLSDGKKAFVWGALPGEEVVFIATKNRKDFIEGIATEITKPSAERVEPLEPAYLSTSPWQIMSEEAEDSYKKLILSETMSRAGVLLGSEIVSIPTKNFYRYRNKMEYSFYGDEAGLHLALYDRGTHRKQPVPGSYIAMTAIDEAANHILSVLQKNNVRAGDIKSLVLRASQSGQVVAALFVRDLEFLRMNELGNSCKGIAVVYSNPKSPASVRTEDLYKLGDISLSDLIGGIEVSYDVFSFFQVNVPVFNQTVESIRKMVAGDPAIDMYSGVGSIGLAIPSVDLLVESDTANIKRAKANALKLRSNVEVVHTKSETALDYISSEKTLILDPPRAGLHNELIGKILETKPPKIIYLSCSPSTQARDIALLQEGYILKEIQSYNFFPRTPHIESLAHVVRR